MKTFYLLFIITVMNKLALPNHGSSAPTYIVADEVVFKPADGYFRYFRKEDKDISEQKTVTGHIVGIGFKLKNTIINKKNPSATKAFTSNEFGFSYMKSGKKIYVNKFEGKERSLVGSKSFAEWKEEMKNSAEKDRLKTVKCIYVYDITADKIMRIEVGGFASTKLTDVLKRKDIPGYLATFKVSSEPVTHDYGESYVPTIDLKEVDLTAEQIKALQSKIDFVDSILNGEASGDSVDAIAEAAEIFE